MKTFITYSFKNKNPIKISKQIFSWSSHFPKPHIQKKPSETKPPNFHLSFHLYLESGNLSPDFPLIFAQKTANFEAAPLAHTPSRIECEKNDYFPSPERVKGRCSVGGFLRRRGARKKGVCAPCSGNSNCANACKALRIGAYARGPKGVRRLHVSVRISRLILPRWIIRRVTLIKSFICAVRIFMCVCVFGVNGFFCFGFF